MTLIRDSETLDAPSPDAAEALIEEARRRHRRRLFSIAAAVLCLGAGGLSYGLVAGSGSPKPPPLASSALGIPPSESSLSQASMPDHTLLVSCAQEGFSFGQSIPSNAKFSPLESGTVGSTPWSFWVWASAHSAPVFAGVAGSGSNALCIRPGTWGGRPEAEAFAQFPGKPVAFIFGYVPKTAVHLGRSHRKGIVTGLGATLNGIKVSVTPTTYGSSRYRLLFAEVTGFRCATSLSSQAGIYFSFSIFAGSHTISSGIGSVGATGNGVNARSTVVSCVAVVPPLEDLATDLATGPPQLRLAALRTMDLRSVEIRATVEHPPSARRWATYVSTYNSPDRFASTGPTGPGVRATEAGCYGFTAAQVLAFGDLLITLHTGSHFQPVDGGYSYTSDSAGGPLPSEQGWGGSCFTFDYAGNATVHGTITIAHGYVTSITTTLLFAGCTPSGPSCYGTTTTDYSNPNSAPVLQVPNAKDS